MAQSKKRNIKNNKTKSWYSPKNPNTWSLHITEKPGKFKVIDGKERIYSCNVVINFITEAFTPYEYSFREFKFKQIPKTRQMDKEFVSKELIDFFGFCPTYEVGYFLRDKTEFAYLKSIEIEKEKFYKAKQIFDRTKKLKRIFE